MVSFNGYLESDYGLRKMTFTLEGKSPDYIETLNELVTECKFTDPLLIKIFCKYADPDHGSIVSRRGIFTLLSEDDPGLVIQDGLPYLLLNPSTLRDAKKKNLGEIEYTRLPRAKIMYKLDKFEKLLFVMAREWHTSIGEVCAIWISKRQICLKAIGTENPGYFYSNFKLKEDWKDVYTTEGSEIQN